MSCSPCKTWFTCGRYQSFPAVEWESPKCDLDYFDCIAEHYRHRCGHDFTSGPWVELENGGGSSSCACGLTSLDHDMAHAP